MATEDQLSQALIRADAAGDAEGARILAAELAKVRAQGYVRPPVDDATANLDPRDFQGQRREAPAGNLPGALREVYRIGPLGGVARGVRDLGEGAAQLMARAGRAVGLVSDDAVQAIDRSVQRSNDQYLYETGRQPGELDLARAGGNAYAAAVAVPMRAAQGATWLARAGQGAKLGALGGALQPVTDITAGRDFASQKGEQVITGATVGAVATPATEAVMRIGSAAANAIAGQVRKLGASRLSPSAVDDVLQQVAEREGVRWASLAEETRAALRSDVEKALRAGGELTPQQVARLADLRAVGATPTRGAVTLDPVQVSRERNLAKLGANSDDPALQRLAQVESESNAALIGRINALRGPSQVTEDTAGARVINALRARDEQAQGTARDLYARAEQSNPAGIEFDGLRFVDEATGALDASRRGAFLPAQIRSVLQDIAERQRSGTPMTLADVEQLRTILAAEARKAERAGDGNVARAVAVVRDSLEAVPARNLDGTAANEAFQRARAAHRGRMQAQDRSPALAAAIDDAEPDRFLQRYVIGAQASAEDARRLARNLAGDPDALDSVRVAIVDHLKRQALNGASEEGATFSQSAFNKALQAIGDRKLRAFFSEDEIAQLKQIGRAARYLQVQPKGSAVNTSNTASAALGVVNRFTQQIPIAGPAVADTLRGVAPARQARNALLSPLPTPAPLISDEAIARLLPLSAYLGGGAGAASAR
jgi:hypothetical protein